MKLMPYIEATFAKNTPIFAREIKIDSMTHVNIRKSLSKLVEQNELKRFSQGVYFISSKNILGDSVLSPMDVIEKKYVTNGKEIYGFYSGLSYANSLGVTTQVPNIREIVSNNESSIKRSIKIDFQSIIVRKAYTTINKTNYELLQFLEYINFSNPTTINENRDLLVKKIKQSKFDLNLLQNTISSYPAKTAKKLIESGLFYEFTS